MKGDSIMEYLLEEYGDVIICITGLAIAFTFLGICMNKCTVLEGTQGLMGCMYMMIQMLSLVQ